MENRPARMQDPQQLRVFCFFHNFSLKGLENESQNQYHKKWLLALAPVEC
jgi:hypothetical protein